MSRPGTEECVSVFDQIQMPCHLAPNLHALRIKAEIRRRVEAHDALVAALEEANEVLGWAIDGDDVLVSAGVTSARTEALLARVKGEGDDAEAE